MERLSLDLGALLYSRRIDLAKMRIVDLLCDYNLHELRGSFS